MAKVKAAASVRTFIKKKIRRKGVHAKKRNAVSKGSKNYKKSYRGQGR